MYMVKAGADSCTVGKQEWKRLADHSILYIIFYIIL